MARVFVWTGMSMMIIGGLGWGGWWLWNYRQSMTVSPDERTPVGIWCVQKECKYFDRSATVWGSAVFSRGPLLLLVEDERAAASASPALIASIFTVVDGLPDIGIHVQSVKLPDTAPGDLRLTIDRPYPLLFDAQGDIADQLATLAVLLADRAKDPAWAPQYIDVRTPGRVYYR
jgi:hypothetical protein